ncbi:MAG: hypothetical protein IJ837_03935 [Clostridia bacterium]|nr:hypothetical protein [Clostridia bacterium]
MIFKQKQTVLGFMCWKDTKLTPIGVFELVEDATINLFSKYNLDGVTLRQNYDAMWVIVKNRIKFFKEPKWGEEITIKSFVTEKSLVKICVDVCIENNKKEVLYYSKVEFCVLDIKSAKIKKLSSVGADVLKVEKPKYLMNFERFDEKKSELFEKIKVKSTNLDFSNHTNNVEYVRFLINSYSLEEIFDRKINEIEINYISQSFEKDELLLYKTKEENKDYIFIKKGEQLVVKSEITFEK